MNLRKLLDIGLPLLGAAVIFAAILVPQLALNLPLQAVVTLVGILILEVGVWQLATPLLVEDRQFLSLRQEVDAFIDLVRELNAEAVRARDGDAQAAARKEEVLERMRASVGRMSELAGSPDRT